MNMLARRSRVALAIFVVAIVVESIGLAPTLQYISGAFPTHFHTTESIILLFVLVISLVMVSFFQGRSRYAALMIIGALMFYSGYYAIVIAITGVQPLHARIIWTSVCTLMTGTLAWIALGAYRLGVFNWRGLIASFMIAAIGIVYLYSV